MEFDCDIYITGSNAKLLSGELATVLGGRYVEFTIYPREKTGYVYTPLYYRWDESFDFTFTVK